MLSRSLYRALPLFLACLLPHAPAGEAPADGRNAKPAAFSFADVQARARELAAAPYEPPGAETPAFLGALSRAEWTALRYRLGKSELWGEKARPALSPLFLLPGYFLNQTAAVNLVDENGARTLPFAPERIEAPDKNLAEKMRGERLGFAGFRFLAADPKGETELPGTVGASHLQFAARNARPGPFARPLALDTALPSGEQYCRFREFWLRKPADGDASAAFYALMDAPSLTGAFEFVLSPGTSAVVDVRASLHPRRGAPAPEKIGLAPISGMFLHSETTGRRGDDFRPEAHSCDGLLVALDGDWQWTPLKNPGRLAVASSPAVNPRGFGLLQRDAAFDHYQDLDNRYDLASSLWVEPKGDWGAGRIELVEIPDDKDCHANIVAYWVPDANAGPEEMELAYRLYWTPPGWKPHDLGVARDTRIARSDADGAVTLIVDFEGGTLGALPADTGLTSVVEVPREAALLEKRLTKNEATGGWRLALKIAPPRGSVLDSLLAVREGPAHLPIAAHLKQGENLSEALTETWRYNLIP